MRVTCGHSYDLVIASMVMHHVRNSETVLKKLSDLADKRFCLVEFDDHLKPHATYLESLGWHLEACGKIEFDIKPEFYHLLEAANVEGADHADMPEYHKRVAKDVAEHAKGDSQCFKVTMHWYSKK